MCRYVGFVVIVSGFSSRRRKLCRFVFEFWMENAEFSSVVSMFLLGGYILCWTVLPDVTDSAGIRASVLQ